MTKRVAEMIGGETYEYYPLGNYVVRAAGICGGRPTFKYTRIEATGIIERLAKGESMEEIIEGYQGKVSRQAIMEALRLASSVSIK